MEISANGNRPIGWSQRLLGLELLRSHGLPVPEWQMVGTAEQIAQLRLTEVSSGWTVRTVRPDGGNEFGMFFANHVEADEIAPLLALRLAQFGSAEAYIVYPSWDVSAFFNVIRQDDGYVVEGSRSETVHLSRGSEPDFRGNLALSGPVDLPGLCPAEIAALTTIRRLCRRLPYTRFYTEAALTTGRAVYFFDLFGIGAPLVAFPPAKPTT